jgi:hypothetical protein
MVIAVFAPILLMYGVSNTTCKRHSNSLSGGASRRIALRNDETDTTTPLKEEEEEFLNHCKSDLKRHAHTLSEGRRGREVHPRS